jgi:hypothetical protein
VSEYIPLETIGPTLHAPDQPSAGGTVAPKTKFGSG